MWNKFSVATSRETLTFVTASHFSDKSFANDISLSICNNEKSVGVCSYEDVDTHIQGVPGGMCQTSVECSLS